MTKIKDLPPYIKELKMYGNYYVSPEGEVYNRYGLKLKQQTHHGYKKVSILYDGEQKTVSVHRMVAILYIPNPYNLPEVNHKDGNKANNTVDNLEWITRQENIIHSSVVLGLRKENPKLSIPVICLDTGEVFTCTRTAHEKYPQCTQAHITACCKRFRRITTGGLRWAYWKPNELVKLLFDCGYKKYPESYEGDEYYCYLCLAQRWLREVKDIDVYIFPTTNTKRGCVYEWGIKTFGRALWVEGQPYTNQYETYEEAQEAGIKKVLEIILEKGE